MSRYFQSTYHGSNDYKKYREERLSKNNQTSSLTTKRPFTQALPPRQQSAKHKERQHLQTFGRETGRSQSRNFTSYEIDQTSKRYLLKDKQPQKQFIYPSNNYGHKKRSDLKISQDEKITKYMKDRYRGSDRLVQSKEEPKYDRETILHQRENKTNWRESSRNRHPSLIHRQIENQATSGEDFQDAIIKRSKNFECSSRNQNKQVEISSKPYAYSNRLQKKGTQNFSLNFLNDKQGTKGFDIYMASKAEPHSDLATLQADTLPYRSRNQMIKQRLNLAHNQPASTYRDVSKNSLLNIDERKGFQTKRQQRPSLIRTVQVTPQKSSLSIREDKNASQQRRKSLIQKSQMLKEKLNRLNASSNKPVQNQQNFGKQKMSDKENLLENYTPKRYTSHSFTTAFENSQNINKSVSKRLNFEESSAQIDPLKNIDRNACQQRQATNKNSSINPITKSYYQRAVNQSGRTEGAGEGALKKISELNQRINSRLESILKNYG